MKIRRILLIISITLFVIISCKDIFEDDISNNSVYLYTPYDSMVVNTLSVDFWWEFVDGADAYNLQVVTPDFDGPQRLILDTNVNGNKFQYDLYPGSFECRVMAYNSAYSTGDTYARFFIKDTTDLTNEKLQILYPPDNFITNKTEITLRWKTITKASKYVVIIKYNNWQGEEIENQPDITTTDSVTVTLDEGVYMWGVQGINESTTATPYSIQRFTIDTTSPGIPELLTPADSFNVENFPVSFSWKRHADNGSALFDSLYISSDSLFKETESTKVNATSYDLDTLNYGRFFWKLITYDVAGNQGKESVTRVMFYNK